MLSILCYGSFLISSIYANDYAAPEPPVDNSYVSEPVDNSYVSEPVDNSYVSEPVDNSYAPPADNSYVSEPVDNSYAPPQDDSYAPPADNSYVSEPVDNSYVSEPVDNSYVSEPVDNSYAPPQDDSYASEPVDNSYTAPQDSYTTPQDAYTAPVDAYTAPQPDYSSPPPSPVIYVPTAKSWADAQAYCASRNSNLLTITGDNLDAMVDCAEYLSPTGLAWTGLNRLGPDGYGTSTYEFVSGVDFPGADAYGEGPFALGDGYSDGNCAYISKGLQTSNMGFQCDETLPFCCDPVTEAYPSSMTNSYDSNVPDTGYTGGGSTGSGSGTPIGGSDYTGPSPDNNVDPSCPRVRKEWNTATQAERQLYIDAILQLSADGTLQKFVEQHSNMISDRQAHGTSAFLPWHRAFLFELEDQIRALGGRFACTALLYWNWARDVELYGHAYSDYSILNSGLGGSGDPLDNYCVNDGAFTKSAYTPYKCEDSRWMSTEDGKCCLRRNTANNYQSSGMLGLRGMLNAIISDSYYGIDKDNVLDGIRDNLEKGPHDISHCTIGGCRRTQYADSRGHLGSSSSPDDPIFWLLHGFVDYAWALWQDFYEYEIMHKDYLTQAAYNGQASGSTGSISRLDDKLSFIILNQQTPGFLKYINSNLAIRDVHSITEMGYQYHMGSFIPDSKIYTCGLNSEWFVGVMPDCSGGGGSDYTGGSTGSGSTGSGDSYTAPATDTYTQPATDSYTQPATDTYAQPATDTYSQPATDTYAQPATDTYSQPATDTYAQPATDTYAQPDTNDGYGLPPAPDSNYGAPADSYSTPVDSYSAPVDTYGETPVDTGYATAFDPSYSAPVDTGYGEVSINGGYTDGSAIDNSLYEIISASYGDRQYTIEGKQEMTATLAKMECEIQMSGYSGCTRPQFFYNCCDLPRTGNSYGNYPDIDVTLEQLLEWAPTDCMKETRLEMFGWAMEFGSLYRLCRGDYDTFCDGDFLQGSYGDTCVTLDQYTSSYGGDSNTGGSYSSPPADSSYGAPADSSYGAPADSSYAAPADSSYAPPVDESYSAVSGGVSIDQQPITGVNNNSGKFNQLEAMVLNGVINGIIFSIIIVLFMTIYVCYRRYYNGPYTKVKFDNDVEN